MDSIHIIRHTDSIRVVSQKFEMEMLWLDCGTEHMLVIERRSGIITSAMEHIRHDLLVEIHQNNNRAMLSFIVCDDLDVGVLGTLPTAQFIERQWLLLPNPPDEIFTAFVCGDQDLSIVTDTKDSALIEASEEFGFNLDEVFDHLDALRLIPTLRQDIELMPDSTAQALCALWEGDIQNFLLINKLKNMTSDVMTPPVNGSLAC